MNDQNRSHLVHALHKNVRSDGRTADQYRPVSITYGVSESAEGSARVSIGNTCVIAGVKLSIEKPYADTPETGNLMVNVELSPMANPKFETGAPTIQAIELARVTDRAVRESKAIDVDKLCFKVGEAVWTVSVDVCTLNDDGNLFDACFIASIAALLDAKLPAVKEEDGRFTVDYKKKTDKKLPFNHVPMSVTVYKIGDTILVDPLSIEEEIYDSRLTVASLKDGTLCALQKGGNKPFMAADIMQMVELALAKSQEHYKQLGL